MFDIVLVFLTAETPTADAELFERKIAPLLDQHCKKCHGRERIRNGLSVNTREDLLKGGERGPAIVPGQPAKSLLIEAIRYDGKRVRMPPAGKLTMDQIADLEEWIRRGAPWRK